MNHMEPIFQDLLFCCTKKVPQIHNQFCHFCHGVEPTSWCLLTPWYRIFELHIFFFVLFRKDRSSSGGPRGFGDIHNYRLSLLFWTCLEKTGTAAWLPEVNIRIWYEDMMCCIFCRIQDVKIWSEYHMDSCCDM